VVAVAENTLQKRIVLTEEQEAAAEVLRNNQIALLTGFPGTGKTVTLSQVARSFDPSTTFCCAPTGRAAQRMSEALAESRLSLTATTIHSLLGPDRNGHDKKGWGFRHNKFNRLPAKTVIADEMSMVDNSTFNALVTALPDDCQLILIGDPNQLPPVGVGAALRDMINSAVIPHAKLTKVHRYAGRIAHVCQSINQGRRWQPSPALDENPDAGEFGPENLKHMERKTPSDCIDAMEATIDAMIKRRGYDPMNDIQVLCSRNDQGPLNRVELNKRLQHMLNPDGEKMDGVPFRVGDKIMCLQNGYRESFARDGAEKLGQLYVANGEIGTVVQIGKKDVLCRINGAHIKFPKGAWDNQLTLSYAITVWKAQGGGFPVCIHMIDEGRNVDRSLIYTSLSRSKRLCCTIGKLTVLHQQCERVLLEDRKTLLSERLRERTMV
jgi:exodeoxyribonuclease V alpha subunit